MKNIKNKIIFFIFFIILIFIIFIYYSEIKNNNFKIIFVGDICLDKALYKNKNDNTKYISELTAGNLINKNIDFLEKFNFLFKNADKCIGNLETAITEEEEACEKDFTFNSDESSITFLKKYFDALSIANNHSYDYGKKGFMDTITKLNKYDLKYFGGGKNLVEARKPIFYFEKGIHIAVLSYDLSIKSNNKIAEATNEKPGIVWAYKKYLKNDIEKVKNKNIDFIILYIHWGKEYEKIASELDQLDIAQYSIDCGVDIIIGTHPHVPQNIDIYKGKPIFYSLGNFIFNGFVDVPSAKIGWILELELLKNKKINWQIHYVNIDYYGIPHYGGKLPKNFVGEDKFIKYK
jgi:hypothetical protein